MGSRQNNRKIYTADSDKVLGLVEVSTCCGIDPRELIALVQNGTVHPAARVSGKMYFDLPSVQEVLGSIGRLS